MDSIEFIHKNLPWNHLVFQNNNYIAVYQQDDLHLTIFSSFVLIPVTFWNRPQWLTVLVSSPTNCYMKFCAKRTSISLTCTRISLLGSYWISLAFYDIFSVEIYKIRIWLKLLKSNKSCVLRLYHKAIAQHLAWCLLEVFWKTKYLNRG